MACLDMKLPNLRFVGHHFQIYLEKIVGGNQKVKFALVVGAVHCYCIL